MDGLCRRVPDGRLGHLRVSWPCTRHQAVCSSCRSEPAARRGYCLYQAVMRQAMSLLPFLHVCLTQCWIFRELQDVGPGQQCFGFGPRRADANSVFRELQSLQQAKVCPQRQRFGAALQPLLHSRLSRAAGHRTGSQKHCAAPLDVIQLSGAAGQVVRASAAASSGFDAVNRPMKL